MANIHDVFKDDDVNGQIVGSMVVCGYLYYGEKKASYRQLWAYSETELQQKAEQLKHEMLEENKEIKSYLWPDINQWSLKILL